MDRTGDGMTGHFAVAARLVRIAALTFAVSLLVGFVAVQAFIGRYGDRATLAMLQPQSSDTVLAAAIAEQESVGLTCSEQPSLTDVILFQRAHGERVEVMAFSRAIEASAAREGWIRRYCA